jgi:hypothetical protein
VHHRFVVLDLEGAFGSVVKLIIVRESQAVYTDYLIASLDAVVQEIVDV